MNLKEKWKHVIKQFLFIFPLIMHYSHKSWIVICKSLENLEKYYLELSNMVYFMQEKVEQLGVYADMSASASKEVFSKSYISYSSNKDVEGKSKTTVKENEAKANLDAQYESVVASIYDHAYRIVKNKVSSAQDLMNCIRKIISSRTEEMKLSLYAPKGE